MRKRAFTLIELLIVVVILSILASMGLVSHREQKRRAEFLGALSQMRSLAAVAKNYFLAIGNYATTTSTATTNTVYGTRIIDGNYYNFTVSNTTSPFIMNFRYHAGGTGSSTATYTFDSDGSRISCAGVDCVPDW